jgi:hypothetical protein
VSFALCVVWRCVVCVGWWALRDSNPRPAGCKATLGRCIWRQPVAARCTISGHTRLPVRSLGAVATRSDTLTPNCWDACWDEIRETIRAEGTREGFKSRGSNAPKPVPGFGFLTARLCGLDRRVSLNGRRLTACIVVLLLS